MTGNNIYLSGPEWLMQYDCDVFNAVAGMFNQGCAKLEKRCISLDDIYSAMNKGEKALLVDAAKIAASMRKLAVTYSGEIEMLLFGMGHPLLNFDLIMGDSRFLFNTYRPMIEHISLDQFIYLGGKTSSFQYL